MISLIFELSLQPVHSSKHRRRWIVADAREILIEAI